MSEAGRSASERTDRGFVNDSENAFRTFISFTNGAKSLKAFTSFVNASERNCSRPFTTVHQRTLPFRHPGGGRDPFRNPLRLTEEWVPAFAGMTMKGIHTDI